MYAATKRHLPHANPARIAMLLMVAYAQERERDADIVAAMAAGDRSALTAFYERFAGMMMALLLRMLGSRAEAEDKLQDVFVELWRRAPQYDRTRASVSTWATTVARSRALDAIRARKRRHRESEIPTEDAHLEAPIALRPDEQANRSQEQQLVQRALAELSTEQRQVVELSYFKGLSHSEIAASLALPLGTVKSRILAAMKVLRRTLVEGGTA